MKKMNRREFLTLSGAAVVALSLAGCGGGSSAPAVPTGKEAELVTAINKVWKEKFVAGQVDHEQLTLNQDAVDAIRCYGRVFEEVNETPHKLTSSDFGIVLRESGGLAEKLKKYGGEDSLAGAAGISEPSTEKVVALEDEYSCEDDYFYGQSGELFSYFRIPKALFQDHRFRQLSTDARTLYGILLDRMSLSVKNGWLDEQGRVYIIYTVREVQESLCCAEHKAVKLFRELEDTDLIERKRRGLGRPSLIYVKDFSSGLPKAQVQNCPNSNSGAAESAILEQPKPQANKTDKNKTEWNNPDPIYSGGIREQLEDYFYQVLEVDLLLRLCPDDEDTIYQIVDLLVDTCSSKRKMLRIAGDDKPAEVVRSRLKKLNADHIRFVLGCLAENTAPVRNMKQYLLAMLYNAPTTMNLYYQNKTNHDFARGSPGR